MLVRQPSVISFVITDVSALTGNLPVTNTPVLQRGSLISLVLHMSAGKATTFMLIFSRHIFSVQLMEDAPSGSVSVGHQGGYKAG
jgi:hypothetical protein